jgi:hypothetical protein
MLNEKITQIYMDRAEREQVAVERELVRQQQEMEERMRERERAHESNYENKTQEELEAAQTRSSIRNMTAISVRMENISAHSQTRARMSAEASRLRGEAGFDMHRQRIANHEIRSFVSRNNHESLEAHMQGIADGVIPPTSRWIPMEIGFLFNNSPLAPDGFRGRHLQNLNEGISNLTSAINHQIGAMYRDSQQMQEEHLRISREQANVSEQIEEEQEEENITRTIDIRL